ncbi:hypothetical protein SBA2_70035 [Acidobacteriia bacterium SbA2]|nr:hypothetical protein SBA2_70035 [Acidobacteriia bacterium SbA2]
MPGFEGVKFFFGRWFHYSSSRFSSGKKNRALEGHLPANPERAMLSWNRHECHWDRRALPSGARMDLEFCGNQAGLRRTLGAWHQFVGSRGWRCAGEPGNGWRHNNFRSSGPHNLRIVSGRTCTFRQGGQHDRANVMNGGAVFSRSQHYMLEGRRQ